MIPGPAWQTPGIWASSSFFSRIQAFSQPWSLRIGILRKILFTNALSQSKLAANLGYLYENVVAQLLASGGDELFYHTFLNKASRHNYEIDFLISRKNKICPIEVKSSGYKTHASLDAFSEKFSGRILEKYLLYTKDLQKDHDILCLPVYMAQFL